MKKLRTYLMRYWYLYLFGMICMIAAIVLDMITPQITRRIIDEVIVGGQMQLLMKFLMGVLGIGLARAVLQYAKEFTWDCVGVKIGNEMRIDLFRHIQTLSMDFFDKHNTGELMTRVKDDVDKVWVVLGFVGSLAIEALIHTVFVLTCMYRINPWLTLIPLCVLPVIGFLAVRMENRLGTVYDQISEETAELNTVAQECIAGVRTVKAFAREEYEIKKFSRHNRRFYDLNMKQAKLLADHQPAISFFGKMMLLAVVIVGGFLVIGGKMSLGDLGAFSEYANNVIWPMEILGWLSNDIASAFASWKKIQKVAKSEPQIKDAEDAQALPQVKGRITFDHVSLTRGGQEILHDVSFEVEPGHTLGIMGMTGTGKTTIVSLMQRFYDVTDGRILLDGTDIRKIPLAQLRASLAVVMQEVFLFSDSVSENVRTGQREAMTQETVEWAAERAGAGQFIGGLAEKYDTVIGERGVGLSGGQKQRISIARALAKRAPVLILDDATSALDMETEKQIQHNLKQSEGMTRIIIAHRISAVRDADEIIVLEGGTIAERGTHETLMQGPTRYHDTWNVQYEENRRESGNDIEKGHVKPERMYAREENSAKSRQANSNHVKTEKQEEKEAGGEKSWQ
ncbi:MAG: ABC transporter ATP-binding protein [Lachnospiraceae bacterium]|nr:ABC transporter ATP-binding protein [Lachnospiraceae bacterium]